MPSRKLLLVYDASDGHEADKVVGQLHAALTQNGHTVIEAGLKGTVRGLVETVEKHAPDLVFNICETFSGDAKLESNVAAVLEMMRQPFTGSGQVGLMLAQDKVLTKMVMAAHGVRAPSYVVFYPDRVELGDKKAARFPLMVKPSSLDASIGISADSVVRDWTSLYERVRYVQDELYDTALAEEFIEGREFYVGVLGNKNPEALPVLEMQFRRYDKSEPKVLTAEAKWDTESEAFKKTRVIRPQNLKPDVEAGIQRVALQVFRACQVRDYGRVDMRVRRGKPFVLEVNPNPYLEQTAELAQAAGERGQSYEALIEEIISLAWARYHPEEKPPAVAEA